MRRVIALAAVLVALSPLLAQKSKKGMDEDGEKNSEKSVRSGVLVGKVMNVYEDKQRFRMQVSVPVVTPNPGGAGAVVSAQQAMAQAQAQMASARDVNGLRSAQQAMGQARLQLMRAQAGLYQTKMVNHEVEVDAAEDVVVRMAQPKQDFDEKGKVKKLSKAELKELRGDSKQPGFKAEFSDIQNEQIVRVTTFKKKGEAAAPKAKAAPSKKKKGKDDDDPPPADGLGDKNIQAGLIEILKEAPAPKP